MAAIWFIPFLKYPANPPTVGDPETIVLRSVLYVSFIALSGFGALAFSYVYKKLPSKRKFFAFIGYAIFISITFFVMPPNPDKISAPMELVNGFRIMSVLAVGSFWIALPIILGSFWNKYRLQFNFNQTKNK